MGYALRGLEKLRNNSREIRKAGNDLRRYALLLGVLLGVCLFLAATAAAAAEPHLLLRMLDAADAAYQGVQDYTSIMVSTERIGEALEPEKIVLLKFQRPFKVYMRWTNGPTKGREGLYVAGEHDGRFLIAESNGLSKFFTAFLDTRDPRVMAQSRHPVTDLGIGRLLEIVGENARRGIRANVLRVEDHGATLVAGRPVREIEGVLPRDPDLGYYGYRVRLFFDEGNHLPIRVIVNDWGDRVVEDYTYSQLRLNPGLTNLDFDPRNPEYKFNNWRIPLTR
jgi:outer membrane lipoprotein-sorting protein